MYVNLIISIPEPLCILLTCVSYFYLGYWWKPKHCWIWYRLKPDLKEGILISRASVKNKTFHIITRIYQWNCINSLPNIHCYLPLFNIFLRSRGYEGRLYQQYYSEEIVMNPGCVCILVNLLSSIGCLQAVWSGGGVGLCRVIWSVKYIYRLAQILYSFQTNLLEKRQRSGRSFGNLIQLLCFFSQRSLVEKEFLITCEEYAPIYLSPFLSVLGRFPDECMEWNKFNWHESFSRFQKQPVRFYLAMQWPCLPIINLTHGHLWSWKLTMIYYNHSPLCVMCNLHTSWLASIKHG